MEEFLFFVIPIIVIYFFYSWIQRLEKEIRELRNSLHGAGVPLVARNEGLAANVITPCDGGVCLTPVNSGLPLPAAVPEEDGNFLTWLKEDWLLKLGALIMLLGFGWFVSYAFAQGWIGPVGRITLGILMGVCILGFGWFRMYTYPRQGGVFLGLGSTIVLLTIFAARTIYDMFTPEIALVTMFVGVAFVALASVKFDRRPLALASLVMAGVVPFLTNAPQSDHIGLFAYLFVVVLGAIWIVAITGQRSLTSVALLMIFSYSAPHLVGGTFLFPLADNSVLVYFAYAFSLVFFITNTIGILKSENTKENIAIDTTTAAINGLFLLSWISIAAPEEWKSLIIVGWMMLFAITSFVIFMITKNRGPFFVYLGAGVAMLATATAIELRGAALTIAYIIEAGVLPFIAYAVTRDINISRRLTFLMILPAILSLENMFSNAWVFGFSFPFEDFFVLLLMPAMLFLLGIFFYAFKSEEKNGLVEGALFISGSIYALILLWLSLHVVLANDMATMISLVIYTIIGLIVYSSGQTTKLYGGILLGFVVIHLLLIDVWYLELTGRIITFFVVGTLLMLTAFIGRNKK